MTHPANLDPVISALVQKMPAEGQGFTTGDQERWLDAMRAALAFLYPPEWAADARKRAERTAGTLVIPRVLIEEVDGTLTPGAFIDMTPLLQEAPCSTDPDADAVDDAGSSAGEPTTTGADAADATSSPETPVASPPESAPSSPSSGETAPSTPSPASTEITREQAAVIAGVAIEVPAPEQGRKRRFSADQKGAILRRVVREGMAAVADDTLIHTSTLNRWAREMPIAFKTFTDEWEAEQGPSVEELEAERQRPIPPRPTQDEAITRREAIVKRAAELAAKPAVQWPSAPMERRPVDHERTRREQADWA